MYKAGLREKLENPGKRLTFQINNNDADDIISCPLTPRPMIKIKEVCGNLWKTDL